MRTSCRPRDDLNKGGANLPFGTIVTLWATDLLIGCLATRCWT